MLVVGGIKEDQDEEVVVVVALDVPVEEVGEETIQLLVEVEALEEGQDEVAAAAMLVVVAELEVGKEGAEAEILTRLTRTTLLASFVSFPIYYCCAI